MPLKVAAVTMAYNEATYLPVWTRHYARQVGADHCYVVDHGSGPGAELPRGVNRLRLPRSPHDDAKRALFMSSLIEGLLEYYDWAVYTDVDEILLADPADFADLPAFCGTMDIDTVTAIGLDVQHVPALEAALDGDQAIGQQRGWARFSSAMCKPVLTRTPLIWSPGFHCANAPLAFRALYLFHLRCADYATSLERLEKTRTMSWVNDKSGAHQRVSDNEWTRIFDSMAAFERKGDVVFDPGVAPLSEWLDRVRQSGAGRVNETYTHDLQLNAAELWAIPPRFREKL